MVFFMADRRVSCSAMQHAVDSGLGEETGFVCREDIGGVEARFFDTDVLHVSEKLRLLLEECEKLRVLDVMVNPKLLEFEAVLDLFRTLSTLVEKPHLMI